jgi:radical SAM protein with 4Fe4S-binding SPASM domain
MTQGTDQRPEGGLLQAIRASAKKLFEGLVRLLSRLFGGPPPADGHEARQHAALAAHGGYQELRAADLDQESLVLFRKGLISRNACLDLVASILSSVDRTSDEVSGATRKNLVSIQNALGPYRDLSRHPRRSVNQELSDIVLSGLHESGGAAAFRSCLEDWCNSLATIRNLLIRLQRYAAVIALKNPSHIDHVLSASYEPADRARARELNQEILTCELLLGKSVVTSTPPNIQIEPTNRCNARCKPCPHASPVGKTYSDLDPHALHKIPHVLSLAQFVELFALGEPSIAPSFGALVALCEGQGCETHVITNGTSLLRHPDFRKFTKIGVSLDGDNRETFEAIRVGINFDALIESVRIFRSENPDIFLYFTCTINRANIEQIPGMARMTRELGLNAICFHRMFEVDPSITSEVLKLEDLALYRENVEEARAELTATGISVFDYAILDRSEPETEPLDPARSLVTIRSFSPRKDDYDQPIAEAISAVSNASLELLPRSGSIAVEDRPAVTAPSSPESAEQYSPTSKISREIDVLEARATALRSEVLSKTASELSIPYCFAAWSRLIVKADGRMFPCSCWSSTYANLKEIDDFDASWNGEFHQQLRSSFHGRAPLNARCQRCPSIDRYQGLTETLRVMKQLNIDYDQVPKQPNFNPPPGKLML